MSTYRVGGESKPTVVWGQRRKDPWIGGEDPLFTSWTVANFHREAPLLSFPSNKVRWVHRKLGNSSFELINASVYVCLAALGLHCCTQAFSSPGPRVTQASHCSGFSCRAWAPEHVGSVVMDSRLSCSVACGILLAQESNLHPLHWQVNS